MVVLAGCIKVYPLWHILSFYNRQINSDNFETTHLNNELFQLFDNRWDWELRYLHPNWSKALDPNVTLEAMMADKEMMVGNKSSEQLFKLPFLIQRPG